MTASPCCAYTATTFIYNTHRTHRKEKNAERKEQMTEKVKKRHSIGNLHENAKPCYVTLQPSEVRQKKILLKKNTKTTREKREKKTSNEMNRNKPILHIGIHENKAAAVEV